MFALRLMSMNKTSAACPLLEHSRNICGRNKNSIYRRGVRFFFKKYLFLTNSITSGVFMGFGDLLQQEFEYQAKLIPTRYDWARAARMFTVGTLMGPMHHYYYVYLDKFLPKTNMKTVLAKVICDQMIASPATILFFFYAMGTLEKKSIEDCNKEIKEKFLYVVMGDWMFWPPVQIINFYYLPTHYRVVYINLATMVFNVFMSYMKHYDQHEHRP